MPSYNFLQPGVTPDADYDLLRSYGTGAPSYQNLFGGGRDFTSRTTGTGSGSGLVSTKPPMNWGGLASSFVPLIVSLFGGDNKEKGAAISTAGQLRSLSGTQLRTGQELTSQGQGAINPVIRYLTAVAGGDPTALLEATKPERARVIDQYDTAKKALEFEPRGGGRASAVTGLEANKARDLALIPALARQAGVRDLGNLGSSLLSQGLGQTDAAGGTLSRAGGLFESLGKQTDQEQSDLGAGIGQALATALPFILAAL